MGGWVVGWLGGWVVGEMDYYLLLTAVPSVTRYSSVNF
jgi:hypothetical protein